MGFFINIFNCIEYEKYLNKIFFTKIKKMNSCQNGKVLKENKGENESKENNTLKIVSQVLDCVLNENEKEVFSDEQKGNSENEHSKSDETTDSHSLEENSTILIRNNNYSVTSNQNYIPFNQISQIKNQSSGYLSEQNNFENYPQNNGSYNFNQIYSDNSNQNTIKNQIQNQNKNHNLNQNLIKNNYSQQFPQQVNSMQVLIQKNEPSNYNQISNFQNIYQNRSQNKLKSKSSSNPNNLLFSKILSSLRSLMTDISANQACPKFFSLLIQSQRIQFLKSLSPIIVDLSLSKISNQTILSILDLLSDEQEKNIFKLALFPRITELFNNFYGVHIIEKMIELYDDTNLIDIYDIIIKNFLYLATSSNGLFVCKKMIIKNKMLTYIDKILFILINNFDYLIHRKYSNFTIQTAVEVWPFEKKLPLFYMLKCKLIECCCEKYSSNVIEKYLEQCPSQLHGKIIEDLSKKNIIIRLLTNFFGNFVLLKLINVCSLDNKISLVNIISANIEQISDSKFYIKWKYILLEFIKNLSC